MQRTCVHVSQGRATYTMEFAKYSEAPSEYCGRVLSKERIIKLFIRGDLLWQKENLKGLNRM